MFHDVQEVVEYDILQNFHYYLNISPLHIIPCWLTYSHVVRLSGFKYVSILGIVAALACLAIYNILSMHQQIVIRRRVESSLTLSVSSLLFEECIDLFQFVGAVIKLSGQARLCFSQSCYDATVSLFGSCQVGQSVNGCFSHLIFSLANSCIFCMIA
jgi:hypothetical protein